jgi:hypothetical protein
MSKGVKLSLQIVAIQAFYGACGFSFYAYGASGNDPLRFLLPVATIALSAWGISNSLPPSWTTTERRGLALASAVAVTFATFSSCSFFGKRAFGG